MLKLVSKGVVFLLLLSTFAHSECSDAVKDIPITSKLATSSTYANLRGSADSLKVLSKELMLKALTEADTVRAPDSFCPASCTANHKPEIVFASTPNKYLTDYDDAVVCSELKKQTLAAPIEFKNRVFPSLDELNSYYSDLTRGYGEDGKALHKICHSSCSPSYKSVISKLESGYRMDTEIICNDARDKSEGMYSLNSSYRWSCSSN